MNQQSGGSGPDWYRLTAEESLERLDGDGERGLSARQAVQRLHESGPNALAEGRQRS